MIAIRKKLFITAVAITLVLTMSFSALALNELPKEIAVNEEYEITTLKDFKAELKNVQDDGKITQKEKNELINGTAPEVVFEFYDEKLEEVFIIIHDFDIDAHMEGDSDYAYCEELIELDDNCIAQIIFEDGEELGPVASLLEKAIPEVYAATNGETKWKSYGNRYFTAKATVQCGAGAAGIALENHYKVSKDGLDERWGDAYVTKAVGVGGSISAEDPKITDAAARTEGKSDINMYARYPWTFNLNGVGSQGTWKLSTSVKYLKKDSKNKRIQVKHSWKKSHS